MSKHISNIASPTNLIRSSTDLKFTLPGSAKIMEKELKPSSKKKVIPMPKVPSIKKLQTMPSKNISKLMENVREHEKEKMANEHSNLNLDFLPYNFKGILSGQGYFAGPSSEQMALQRMLLQQSS